MQKETSARLGMKIKMPMIPTRRRGGKAGRWWLKCRMQMQNADVFGPKNASTIDILGFDQPAIWVLGFGQPAASAFDIWDKG